MAKLAGQVCAMGIFASLQGDQPMAVRSRYHGQVSQSPELQLMIVRSICWQSW